MSEIEELPRWREILREQIAKTSAQEVGEKLGYARSTISLVNSGKYNGNPQKIVAKVLLTFSDYVHCPHLQTEIETAQCRKYQQLRATRYKPRALAHWAACRRCQFCHHEGKGPC